MYRTRHEAGLLIKLSLSTSTRRLSLPSLKVSRKLEALQFELDRSADDQKTPSNFLHDPMIDASVLSSNV
jgi:hypothetical protein